MLGTLIWRLKTLCRCARTYADGRERVPQIVRHDGEHIISMSRRVLGRGPGPTLSEQQLGPLAFQANPLGDVAHSAQNPDGASGLIAEDSGAVGHVDVVAVAMTKPVQFTVATSPALQCRA